MRELAQLREAFPQIDWSAFSDWRGPHFLGPVGKRVAIMVIPCYEFRGSFQALLKRPHQGVFVVNQQTLIRGPIGGATPTEAVRKFLHLLGCLKAQGEDASDIIKFVSGEGVHIS